jgi:hypothetical protein
MDSGFANPSAVQSMGSIQSMQSMQSIAADPVCPVGVLRRVTPSPA